MTFSKDHWDDYDAPELAVSLLRDAEGTPFLLLAGLEPDREWEAFTAAVMQLSAGLRTRLTVGFHGIPMGVPHTRQLGVTAHATQPELIEGYRPLVDNLQVPGSAAALLEYRLGAAGRGAMGFAVHVPHYLAQAAYPAAAVTLLESVQRATGLVLPADALRKPPGAPTWRLRVRSRDLPRWPKWCGPWSSSTTRSPPTGRACWQAVSKCRLRKSSARSSSDSSLNSRAAITTREAISPVIRPKTGHDALDCMT